MRFYPGWAMVNFSGLVLFAAFAGKKCEMFLILFDFAELFKRYFPQLKLQKKRNRIHVTAANSVIDRRTDLNMKNDIKTREDIVLLVNTFYDKIKADVTIGYIFDTVANVDWSVHLPKMYSFWSSILLGEKSFEGNPMKKHIELGKMTRMTETEFSAWKKLFTETVHELFDGEKASEALTRAENIARLMLFNIEKNRSEN